MYTVIDEPKLVRDLHSEYFRLINTYHNTKRPAAFIKYFNLVTESSPVNSETQATYDRYIKTRAYWDVYELTPAFTINAIQNAPGSVQDLKGQMIEGATTITTYTIENPRIDDLIVFYDPIKSEEVFRVANLRLQINSAYSEPKIRWFELDLETAPLRYEKLGNLQKRNHYIYDLTQERNMEYKEYKEFVSKITNLKNILKTFHTFYSYAMDLYLCENKIPAITNELIYLIKRDYNNKYNRLFEDIFSPFGYWDKYGMKFKSIEDIKINNIVDVFDLITKKWEQYVWEYDSTTDPNDLIGLDLMIYKTLELKQMLERTK